MPDRKAAAKGAAVASTGPAPVEAAPAKAKAKPQPVARAGGHVDYDDGRGWVLEED